MNGEVITVCQDCGHLIEPVRVASPFEAGTIYEITLCQRAECMAERVRQAWLADFERLQQQRMAAHWAAASRSIAWAYAPVTTAPRGIIGVTGI